jgi:hypothetical protein
MTDIYQIKKELKPRQIRWKNKFYDINWIHEYFIIRKYDIIVNNRTDNKLEGITLYNIAHPNAYILEENLVKKKFKRLYKKTNFCISDTLKGAVVDKEVIWRIEFMLKEWNLNSAHYWPNLTEKYIRYEGERLPVNNPFEGR